MLDLSWTFFNGLIQTSDPKDLDRLLETQPDLKNLDIVAPIKFKDELEMFEGKLEDQLSKKPAPVNIVSQTQPEAVAASLTCQVEPALTSPDDKAEETQDQENFIPYEEEEDQENIIPYEENETQDDILPKDEQESQKIIIPDEHIQDRGNKILEELPEIKEPLDQGYDSAFASQAISTCSSMMSLNEKIPEKVEIFGASRVKTHSRSQSAQLYVSQMSSTMTSGAASELNLNEKSRERLQSEINGDCLQRLSLAERNLDHLQRSGSTETDQNFVQKVNEALSAKPQIEKD